MRLNNTYNMKTPGRMINLFRPDDCCVAFFVIRDAFMRFTYLALLCVGRLHATKPCYSHVFFCFWSGKPPNTAIHMLCFFGGFSRGSHTLAMPLFLDLLETQNTKKKYE